MKKLFSILFTLLLLVGCGGIKGKELYKAIDDALINELDKKTPTEVDIDDYINGVGLCYEGEEAQEIIDLFKQITIGEECEMPEMNKVYGVSFYYEDDSFASITFYDDVVEMYSNDTYSYYKAENSFDLLSLIEQRITDAFNLDVVNVEILNQEGLTLSQGEYYIDESGNVVIEIECDNQSDKAYGICLQATVNGHEVHNYQSLICSANSSSGYYGTIPSEVLLTYGINEIGKVEYYVDVYEYDDEKFERGDYVCSSEIQTIEFGSDNETINKDNVVYDENGIIICDTLNEHDMYTVMHLYLENNNNIDIKVCLNEVLINGEHMNIYGYDEVYNVSIKANSDKVALLPLSNYVYDEENQMMIKDDIESLELAFYIEIPDSVIITDMIKIK